MKQITARFLAYLLLVLFLPLLALAQDDISQTNGIISNGRLLGARTYDGQTIVGILGVDANGSTVIDALSGKSVIPRIAKTPAFSINATGIIFDAAGKQIRNSVLPAVMTPITALTPNAGDVLVGRVSIMATAAPTLAILELPAATANANASFGLYNKSASPTLLYPNGVVAATDSINALGVGTPYSCATAKFCDCRVIGAGTLMCVSL